MAKKENTSWGNVSSWYNELLEENPDSYQNKVIVPNLIRHLNITGKEKILDLACGQGFFARYFSKAGAQVTGADISKELIELAKKNSSQDISYIVAPADNVPVLSESQDIVTIVLALQNIQDVKKVFEESRRVLKKGGRLGFVINHPAFRIPGHSDWNWDDANKKTYRRIDSYMSESKTEINMHPGEQKKTYTISFHRPLQHYVKLLRNSGFHVSSLEEWISHRKSEAGPRQKEEDRMRKEIPLFMYIEAFKQ